MTNYGDARAKTATVLMEAIEKATNSLLEVTSTEEHQAAGDLVKLAEAYALVHGTATRSAH